MCFQKQKKDQQHEKCLELLVTYRIDDYGVQKLLLLSSSVLTFV